MEICFDIPATDPDGNVQWTDNIYIQRCGAVGNKIERGYCGKTYWFRSCWILGREMRANVCTRCDLRYSIVVAGTNQEKRALSRKLAKILGCSSAQAFHQAYAAFGYLADNVAGRPYKPKLYPLETGLEKVIEFHYPTEPE